jgi:hypothetical protein
MPTEHTPLTDEELREIENEITDIQADFPSRWKNLRLAVSNETVARLLANLEVERAISAKERKLADDLIAALSLEQFAECLVDAIEINPVKGFWEIPMSSEQCHAVLAAIRAWEDARR